MDSIIIGNKIKECRIKKNITQSELASKLYISDKTISKWETGRGLPDISVWDDLCKALDISMDELLGGERITNKNCSGNLMRSKFYVCPVCGNIIHSMGEATISCCGTRLPSLDSEPESNNKIEIKEIDGEYYVKICHEMTKEHYISFIALISNDKCTFVKLYPEQNAEARFCKRGHGYIYAYCNKDGLFGRKI